MTNYIADNILAERPPAYFMQRLADFNAQLVLLPSRTNPGVYVLARRKQRNPIGDPAAIIADECLRPDTKMCLLNGLVPVCQVFHTGTGWNPEPLIAKLMARDTWAVGGGYAAADIMDAEDAKAKAKIKADIRDDMYNRWGMRGGPINIALASPRSAPKISTNSNRNSEQRTFK